MAKDRTHTGPALLAHDMGGQKIQSLGTSTEDDGAARVDQLNYVATSDADNTAGKAGRLEHKAVGDGITVTATVQTDPVHGEQVVFSAVASAPPAGEGSWLYTGSIQESNLLDPVKAFVKSLQGMGGLDPGQAELWDVLENGDYQHKAVGAVYGLAPDGTETFALSLGQRVWLTMWLGAADSTYHGGFCTVQTLGDGSTKAVLRPTGESVAVGDMFTVEGVGAEYEGWYWEVLSIPENTLAYRPEYLNETTYNLFTSTNVDRAGTVTRETSVTIPGGTSGGTMFEIPYFEMLDVLGVSTIPKGVVNWEIKAYVVADDPAATVFVRAFLTTDQGILDRFGYGDTPPIHNTSAVILRMQGTISADRDVTPSSKLGAVFYGYSDSASEVTIKLVFNDASHSTRVQTPLTTASFGTLDHGLLTPVSRKFPNTDQGQADAVEWAHPQSGIQPGRILTPSNATVTPVDGLFAVPANSNYVEVDGTDDVIGISTTGWTGTNSKIDVFFFYQRVLKRGQDVPDGYAPLAWGTGEAGYGVDIDTLTVYADCVVSFRLIGGRWRIVGMLNL